MPVDTKHPDYIARAAEWQQMRDFAESEQAVHAAGEKYLPRLTKETYEDYTARKGRASVYGATERTIEGLVGMLFRSAPEREVSPGTEGMLLDVTKSGEDLDRFGNLVAREYLTVGKVVALDDYPSVSTEGLSVAAVEEMNIRPNMARYTAEAFINWEFGWVNNKTTLTMAVLHERVNEPNPQDPFCPKVVDQWRELRLDGGVYTVQLWRRPAAGGAPERYKEPIVPLMNGKPLPEIPLHIFGDGKPPLLALCNVNKSHYQTTADIEHGAHLTALPQAWIAGDLGTLDAQGNKQQPELHIGGGNAWTFGPNTTVGYLEYTGQGLDALEKRLDRKENQMAVLGARMLEQQKSGVEAADTAGMHRSGEQSILQRIAGDLSTGMEKVLAIFDRWAGGTGKVKYQINKDFLPTALSAQEITALVQAWQSGAISHETLFLKLQAGGIVGEGADFETEQEKIANNPPALQTPPAASANDPGAGDE